MTTGAPCPWQLGPFELTARLRLSIGGRSHPSRERARPLSPTRHRKKAFEVARAVPSKLCHVVLESGVFIGRRWNGRRPFLKDTLSDWLNRPPQIRRARVHSFPILPRELRQQRERLSVTPEQSLEQFAETAYLRCAATKTASLKPMGKE